LGEIAMLGFGPIASGPLAGTPLPLWFEANFAKQQQKPDEDRIYAAFGRFIASYALAEAGVHIAARFFLGLPDNKARLVFGGMRLGDVIDRLRQLSAPEHANEIEELIQQLKLIGDARDQFVHRLTKYEHGQGLTVTNRLTCKAISKAEPRTFTLTDLEEMEYDCRVISGRFSLLCDRPLYQGLSPDITLLGLGGAWRYKPLPPSKPPRKQTRDAPQSRKRQRHASRKSQ
jgi:hypothetical protein